MSSKLNLALGLGAAALAVGLWAGLKPAPEMPRIDLAALSDADVAALAERLPSEAPAAAFDLAGLDEAQRAAFRAQVRAYLLDNPEVIFEAVEVMEARQAAVEATKDRDMIAANADAIFDDGYSWIGGNPEGDVTMVEFVDYRCGYCRRAHDEVQQLVTTDGNIRLIMKEFPILGEQSMLSSRFAIAVKQLHGAEAYKAAHDALITMRQDVSDVTLGRLAEGLGHDPATILERMQAPEVTDEIARTRALAQTLGISGTPTFVVQDEMVRGYMPLDGMLELVDAKRG